MPDDDDIAYARERIRHSVWSGFEDAEDRDMIIADPLSEDPGYDEAALRAHAVAEVARKAAAEACLPAVTDCDKLDAVFATLADVGILGLHNAGNTMADGHSEAAEAMYGCRPAATSAIASTIIRTSRAFSMAPLLITFDHVDGEVPDRLKVGQIVDEALRGAGLATDWDGTTARRIFLPSFDWKRRGPD